MSHPNPAEIIEKIEGVSPGKSVDLGSLSSEPEVRLAPNKEHFDALYNTATPPIAQVSPVATTGVERVSLMDEVAGMRKKVDAMKIAPTSVLVAQVEDTVGKIRELRSKLETPDAASKPEWQQSLQDKLSHIDETLKITLKRAGVEYKAPVVAVAPKTPIERFLGLLENGQNQLEHLGSEIALFQKDTHIAPQDMIVLQYKVNLIQQQIELFTSMLNKSLESTKTIMNVQV